MHAPAFLQLRQAVGWLGLLIVTSTITYGLNLFATALVPTAPPLSVRQTAIDHGQDTDNAAHLDDAALEWSSSLVSGAEGSPPSTVVIITGRDAVTGERIQTQCAVDADNVASDVLTVDLRDFSDVVSGLCGNLP
ncbi:MAG: hypothetical protein JO318_16930 [Chloroflexi bacterium]|nr:hypothetical protein [Chloroflexota bacterium]MBV9134392.1 hypothetical protein [Chloroflexota bacterium]